VSVKSQFVVFALVLIAGWWFWINRANQPLQILAGEWHAATHHRETAQLQQQQEEEQERRRAIQEQNLKLLNDRRADYERAVAAYDAQRRALAERIAELDRTNNRGVHNSEIEQLEQKRMRLPLPQPP
jgi:septal ring factor EnvC (AmiA/AmiB activator)